MMPQPGKLLVKLNTFTLWEWDYTHYWLEKESGEGMTVSKDEVFQFFEKLWERF